MKPDMKCFFCFIKLRMYDSSKWIFPSIQWKKPKDYSLCRHKESRSNKWWPQVTEQGRRVSFFTSLNHPSLSKHQLNTVGVFFCRFRDIVARSFWQKARTVYSNIAFILWGSSFVTRRTKPITEPFLWALESSSCSKTIPRLRASTSQRLLH